MVNIDEQLEILFDHAETLEAAERATDAAGQVYMTADELYHSKVWVDEWLEQSPPPKKPNNRWQADSRNRFAQWLAWRGEQAQRHAPKNRHTYRLLNAARVVRDSNLTHGSNKELPTERALRPFNWFYTNRYEDRLPEVVREALDDGTITDTAAKAAVQGWKHAFLTGRRGGRTAGALNAVARAHKNRILAMEAIKKCYEAGNVNEDAQAELLALKRDIEDYFTSISGQGEAA